MRAPTLGDPPLESSEPVRELTVHLSLAAFTELTRGDHYEIVRPAACSREAATKPLPNQPASTVSRHCAADPPTHGQAQAIVALGVLDGHEDEQWARQAHSLCKYVPKLGARPELHPRRERRPAAHRGSGPDALSAFLPPPLQHEPAPLGAHPHQEAMRLSSPTIVGLERPLHDRLASSPQVGSASPGVPLRDKALRIGKIAASCQLRGGAAAA
jgi:hypothetical protein